MHRLWADFSANGRPTRFYAKDLGTGQVYTWESPRDLLCVEISDYIQMGACFAQILTFGSLNRLWNFPFWFIPALVCLIIFFIEDKVNRWVEGGLAILALYLGYREAVWPAIAVYALLIYWNLCGEARWDCHCAVQQVCSKCRKERWDLWAVTFIATEIWVVAWPLRVFVRFILDAILGVIANMNINDLRQRLKNHQRRVAAARANAPARAIVGVDTNEDEAEEEEEEEAPDFEKQRAYILREGQLAKAAETPDDFLAHADAELITLASANINAAVELLRRIRKCADKSILGAHLESVLQSRELAVFLDGGEKKELAAVRHLRQVLSDEANQFKVRALLNGTLRPPSKPASREYEPDDNGPAIGLFTGSNAMKDAERFIVEAIAQKEARRPSSALQMFEELKDAELDSVRELAEKVAEHMNQDEGRKDRLEAKPSGLKNPRYSTEPLTAESVHELVNQTWLNDHHREAIIACIEAGMKQPIAE